MGKILLVVLVLLPCVAMAGTRCWITEFQDHYEAVCVGDEQAVSGPVATVLPRREDPTGQALDRPRDVAPSGTAAQARTSLPGDVYASIGASAPPQTVAPPGTPARATAATSTRSLATTTTGKPPVPTTIGLHRPPQSVRDAARASRARLIMEERQNDFDRSTI